MATVNAALKKELLALNKKDLTVSFLVSKISKTTNSSKDENGRRKFEIRPPAWDLQAKMKLAAGEYTNIEAVETTLGSFLMNKLIMEDNITEVLDNGYFNDVMTSKTFGKIVDRLAMALIEKKIPIQPNVVKFLQAFEFYGLMLCSAVSPSFTPGTLSVNEEVRKERDRLYAEAGENIDLATAVIIEDKLVKLARKLLVNDPGMSLFDSGSRGSFDDNYKNMSIAVGPVKNPATGRYDIIKNNYIDGMDKEDLAALANGIVNGVYPKSIGTAEGGYITKQFYAVFQSIQLDEHGSDCGSKGYLPAYITPSNYDDYMWQYAVEGDKLIIMTSENKSQFVNRIVLLRSPMGCLSPKLCNKCMGERFYILGITNAGLTAGRLPNGILNGGMKAFHNTKVELYTVNPENLLLPV